MIVTQENAKRILAAHFPGLKVRLTTGCTLVQPPIYETMIGHPIIAVRKLAPGKDSAVQLGRLVAGGTVDWNWSGS